MEDQSKKQQLINEVKNEHNNLTALDRRLLKAYFSYIDIKGVLKAQKKKGKLLKKYPKYPMAAGERS